MGVAGSIAGGIAGTLGNPAELMMVRMQADRAKPPAQRYNYRNSVQGLYRMAVDEGIASWFRGVGPNALRSVLMNASQLGAYDWFKSQLQRFMQDGPALHFLASFGAGTFATTVCSPADVLKSRIMNASNNEGVAQVLRTGLAKDGPLFLFKGWTPAWIRLTPTTILICEYLREASGASLAWPRQRARHSLPSDVIELTFSPHPRAAQGRCRPLPQGRRHPPLSACPNRLSRGSTPTLTLNL